MGDRTEPGGRLADARLELRLRSGGAKRLHAVPHRHVDQLVGRVGRQRTMQPERAETRLTAHELTALLPAFDELVGLVGVEFEDVDEGDGSGAGRFLGHVAGIPLQYETTAPNVRSGRKNSPNPALGAHSMPKPHADWPWVHVRRVRPA